MKKYIAVLTLFASTFAHNAVAEDNYSFKCADGTHYAGSTVSGEKKMLEDNGAVKCVFKGGIREKNVSHSLGKKTDKILKELKKENVSPLPDENNNEAICNAYIAFKACSAIK